MATIWKWGTFWADIYIYSIYFLFLPHTPVSLICTLCYDRKKTKHCSLFCTLLWLAFTWGTRAANSFLRMSFGTHPCWFPQPTGWKQRRKRKSFPSLSKCFRAASGPAALSMRLVVTKGTGGALKRFERYQIVSSKTTHWHQHSGRDKKERRETEKGETIRLDAE